MDCRISSALIVFIKDSGISVIWSDASESMIQGLEYFLLTIRVVENLPFCAISPNLEPEADILD